MRSVVEVALGVLVQVQPNGCRVLITRRPQQAVLGGYWEFPGGKVERGEDVKQCVQREFMEEVGLVVRVGQPLPTIEHVYEHGAVRLNPYFCTYRSGEVQHLQVTEHRWSCPSELHRYRFPPANEELIKYVVEALSRGGAEAARQGKRH